MNFILDMSKVINSASYKLVWEYLIYNLLTAHNDELQDRLTDTVIEHVRKHVLVIQYYCQFDVHGWVCIESIKSTFKYQTQVQTHYYQIGKPLTSRLIVRINDIAVYNSRFKTERRPWLHHDLAGLLRVKRLYCDSV